MKPVGIFEGISIIYTSFIENLISIEHTLPLITTPNPSPRPLSSIFFSNSSNLVRCSSYHSIMLMSATPISPLNFCKDQYWLLLLPFTCHTAANHLLKHKVDVTPLLLKLIVLLRKLKKFTVH